MLAGLRMLTTRAHKHSPFFVQYKQDPVVPGRPLSVDYRYPIVFDSDLKDEDKYVQELVALFAKLRGEISGAMALGDWKAKQYHDQGDLLE